MSGCCPTEAALDAVGGDAAKAVRAADLDLAAREVSPGVACIDLIAPSMHCGGCVATLERGLKKRDGVIAARANLTAKRIRVEYRMADLRAADVAEAAEALGFSTHPLEAADAAEAAEKRETRDLLMRLGVAGFAAMNIMLLSVSVWSGAEAATRDLMHWISALIAAPTVFYSGRPFYVSALQGLRAGRLNMDAPISLAVLLALTISFYETINHGPETFFDACTMLLFLLLVGRYLDRLMRARAHSAASALARLQPRGATVITADGPSHLPLAEINVGDLIRVAPGERVAVDGVVTDGRSDLDCAHVTGESAPEATAPGAEVRAGALNLSGAITLRATAVGEESSLSAVRRLMEQAESRKSRIARLADQAASIYAPVVHLLAFATLIYWLQAGSDWREAAFTAIAVLIITCPCALGLAAPMAQATAAGALFTRGIMLKDGAALERLARVEHAIFDKTGTLTLGEPRMREPDAATTRASRAAAAALAAESRHPLSAALAAWARDHDVAPTALRDVTETPGAGVEGVDESGTALRLGSAAFTGADPTSAPDDASAVWLRIGEDAPTAFLFDDALRPGAEAAIAALRADGVSVEMLSGDRPGPVRALASQLGITDATAQATPEEKIARVVKAAARPGGALMIGDGVNDAPALAAATVSIAPADAADIGRAAADLVFFGDDLSAVVAARRVAVATRRIILQNFAIAAGYNCIAIPIAVAGHASPLVAAIAMSTSSILVVANALRLTRSGAPVHPTAPQAPSGALREAAA